MHSTSIWPSGEQATTQTYKNIGNIVSCLFIFSQALIALAESIQDGQFCLSSLGELSVLDHFLPHLFPQSYFSCLHLSFRARVKLVLSCGENGVFTCFTAFCFQVIFYSLLTARLRDEWGQGMREMIDILVVVVEIGCHYVAPSFQVLGL